ncbi:MAG: endonuclease/exonuclease/phosphatase family protein [Paracoccaceae bacterium]
MRIATWNVEWFTRLFGEGDRLIMDAGWSGRHDVTRAAQLNAIARVLAAIDADVILINEAPDTGRRRNSGRALENFAGAFNLLCRRALCGFPSQTQQEITFLYDPDKVEMNHAPEGAPTGKHGSENAPRFDGVFRVDLGIDDATDIVRFSKPPLEAVLSTRAGRAIRLIGVHPKSKALHGARSRRARTRISIANRRKQLAQCIWIRARVLGHLRNRDPLIVLGDLNDGPGLDRYENLFGRSGVEIVIGPPSDAKLRLFDPHAVEAPLPGDGPKPATARFFTHEDGSHLDTLLDYIMVSCDLRPRARSWTIWHPFDNPRCRNEPDLQTALLTASDHFPVTLDIDL